MLKSLRRLCALVGFGLLLCLSAQSWAHGFATHETVAQRAQTPAEMSAQAPPKVSAKVSAQAPLPSQANEAASGHGENHVSAESADSVKEPRHAHSTCVDCHMCCALQMRIPYWAGSHALADPQPQYQELDFSSKPLAPELRPPIHA